MSITVTFPAVKVLRGNIVDHAAGKETRRIHLTAKRAIRLLDLMRNKTYIFVLLVSHGTIHHLSATIRAGRRFGLSSLIFQAIVTNEALGIRATAIWTPIGLNHLRA